MISNVIWMIAVCMYLYTFTSNLFCTYYRSKLGIPLIITETCNTWLVSPEDVTLLETCNHQNCQTCVTVWQTNSDCCSRYRYICLADLCLPQKPSIWEVVHEDREKQIPGYRWHLQDLWRGDLWRVAWLSQCYRVWHYFISIQDWKSETTQENDNSRQVQPLGLVGHLGTRWNMHDTKMAQAKINSTEKIGLGTTKKLLVPKLLWEYPCLYLLWGDEAVAGRRYGGWRTKSRRTERRRGVVISCSVAGCGSSEVTHRRRRRRWRRRRAGSGRRRFNLYACPFIIIIIIININSLCDYTSLRLHGSTARVRVTVTHSSHIHPSSSSTMQHFYHNDTPAKLHVCISNGGNAVLLKIIADSAE